MISNDPDILKWEHTTKITLTIKEAYDIQARQGQDGKDIIWKKNMDGRMVARGHPFPLDGV